VRLLVAGLRPDRIGKRADARSAVLRSKTTDRIGKRADARSAVLRSKTTEPRQRRGFATPPLDSTCAKGDTPLESPKRGAAGKEGWLAISGGLQGGRADFSPQLASLKPWRKISPSAGFGIIWRRGRADGSRVFHITGRREVVPNGPSHRSPVPRHLFERSEGEASCGEADGSCDSGHSPKTCLIAANPFT
jgi:hypothetical protein